MKTLIRAIKIKPMWTSYMSCIAAISDSFGLKHSLPWIFGTSGYGFIMNIHAELCPSGPTAFSDRPIADLCRNLGINMHGIIFEKADPDFDSKLLKAWEMTKQAIDNDKPVVGWEMGIPEYNVIYGYDDENYLFYDVQGNPAKRKWDTLGKTDIGWVSLFIAQPENMQADITKTLKETLTFALEFSKHKKEWSYPLYANGVKAYDLWIKAIEAEKYNPFGMAYNAAVWSECRTMAHAFLTEAAGKLKNHQLDNLIEQYEVISWSLQKVAKLFPIPLQVHDYSSEEIESIIDNLFLAKEAEKAAFDEMKQLLTQL